MKSLIYGYGITGKSIERYLIKNNIDYQIYDDNKDLYISDQFTNNLKDDWDVIYCSPGIKKADFEELKFIAKKDVLTDLDVFMVEDTSIKIGVTGTNRKSTTCFHLHQLLSKDYAVNLIGNIGEPVLDHLNTGAEFSIIELSSQQLDKLKENKLDYGVLLNIAPDHIDYHGSFAEYKSSKERILEAKEKSYENNPYKLFQWITGKGAEVIDLHNLPFRFEIISKSIINDSKSTNMHSLDYAIRKANQYFNDDKYDLIICGNPAKEGFRTFYPKGPEHILIFGSYANKINKCINHSEKKLYKNLPDVLTEISNSKNQNILFSPGYPSGDDFKNFEERGEYFNKLAHEILLK
ncbi:MAG: UDP-N-acetylmuramoylalanine--D-glutamate ligase [SAR86 cluster bacterium]|uniref:UDP-N-acetylmuramoylalanine--D-glutamate ligase n=1 Tax=SAR86 cluster bacterium TaxID=2030880 RepID=A0A937J5I3_9GAMM|nr:UDP-N-acetylmuramoylalanine--D-glutamate ligase [SAR86 cluster bacterium]